MSLEEQIRDIQNKLKKNDYPNEQSISQGVVLRLLMELGWPVYDTQLVMPEFPVKGGRVDFALCVKSNRPIIFVEVKQPGNTLGADEQLFNYAFNRGVPFAIITDGREWHFYLPTEVGSYEQRRLYVLDLIEREVSESAYRLQRYLSFQQVVERRALEHAKEDYKAVFNEREAKESIPTAWEKLLEEKNETVMAAVSEKVESLCGYTPTETQIFAYLRALKPDTADFTAPRTKKKTYQPHQPSSTTAPVEVTRSHTKTTAPRKKIKVTFPDGVEIYHWDVSKTIIDVFRKIGFSKVAAVELKVLGGNPLVSKQQHTRGKYTWTEAGSGFFVCTHSGTAQKLKQLKKVNNRLALGLKIEEI